MLVPNRSSQSGGDKEFGATPRFHYFLFALLVAGTPVRAQTSTPVGVWLHDNKRIEVEIAPCGENLCGQLVWLKSPNDPQGLPLVDSKNPDAALRTRPLLGLTVLDGLHRTGEDTWKDGNIYNPDDGVTYTASMSMLEDGSLQVRAYVLLPMFGKTFIWTRAETRPSSVAFAPPVKPSVALP